MDTIHNWIEHKKKVTSIRLKFQIANHKIDYFFSSFISFWSINTVSKLNIVSKLLQTLSIIFHENSIPSQSLI